MLDQTRPTPVLSRLAMALLADITPRPDGTMPLLGLPCHLYSEYLDAKRELLESGLAYLFEGALFPCRPAAYAAAD